ncbi:MAG TPA: hypothetical protein GX497_11970 [Bacillus bacterium]|nr:hypothetical protein [Bacillus sp. (in: firmicutes)]
MKKIFPLNDNSCTIIYVTDTTPIKNIPHGAKIPDGITIENRNEKIVYDISGLYLVDYTLGDAWSEGSVVVAK